MNSLKEILAPFEGERLLEWFTDLIELWHDTAPLKPNDTQSPKGMTQWVLYKNFLVWHLEEMIRDKNVSAEKIPQIERAIDKNTHIRMDVLEQIDIWIDNVLTTAGVQVDENAPVHSETPANIINRLSVLCLKIYHLNERLRTESRDHDTNTMRIRLNILEEQRRDVAHALDELVKELRLGQKKHKVYRQFKIYNDPSFHPELFEDKNNKGE
ncbi:MAG: DUF4254 domain-containing protein [candidate division KSB1 bacterium]|nr:DUF4254 domain-containing protein [candidate division KSB1 bacterium]